VERERPPNSPNRATGSGDAAGARWRNSLRSERLRHRLRPMRRKSVAIGCIPLHLRSTGRASALCLCPATTVQPFPVSSVPKPCNVSLAQSTSTERRQPYNNRTNTGMQLRDREDLERKSSRSDPPSDRATQTAPHRFSHPFSIRADQSPRLSRGRSPSPDATFHSPMAATWCIVSSVQPPGKEAPHMANQAIIAAAAQCLRTRDR
jgi:hypothetical protein